MAAATDGGTTIGLINHRIAIADSMVKIDRNIVHQLDNRERGYRTRRIRSNALAKTTAGQVSSTSESSEQSFRRQAVELSELVLLERLKTEDLCKPIDDLASETESVFNIEQSHNGLLTATVQTNRSVNVFQTASMQKAAKYPTGDRSVWTLAFHPTNEKIIAFGTLGGTVSVYVNNRLVGTLQEPEPIGSLCFHPTQNYLVLTSMNEVIFWDWDNDMTYTTGMYSDCKCRFLHVTKDSRLITGIAQTQTHQLAGVGSNVEQVEPEYLMVSFLRSVSLMLDRLEQTLVTQMDQLVQYEMNNQCLVWIHLLQTINRKRSEVRCSSTVSPEDRCTITDLNLTLISLCRKVDMVESMLMTYQYRTNTVPPMYSRTDANRLWSPNAVLYTQPLIYFGKICQTYICQGHNSYIKYNFDLDLVDGLLRQVFYMLYKLAPSELPVTWDIVPQLYGAIRTSEKHCVLQAWDLASFSGDVDDLPDFKEDWKNVITVCLINNDSNVAISQCEQFIASVRARTVKELEIRSIRKENFGEPIFTFKFTANFVSLSFSPSARFIAIGLRCRRNLKYAYIIDKDTPWRLENALEKFDSYATSGEDSAAYNARVGIRVCLPRDPDRYQEINCIKWASLPGYGLLVGLKSKFIQVCR
uniref:Uncharacterized protein n=1 Tax=Anopheles dirus TaxID=7168 RepID=A0A182NUK5_9DIPT